MTDHAVEVTSVQIYSTYLYPGSVDEDGRLKENQKDLSFKREETLTFECECGKRFRKWETVAEHLHEVGGDDE